MKRYLKLLLLFLLLCSIGCSSTIPGGLSDSSRPADYGSYEILGSAQGISKCTAIFGIQTSKPNLKAAINQAVLSLDGDALVNVRWHSKTTYWIILPVSTLTVVVNGDVIKYKGNK